MKGMTPDEALEDAVRHAVENALTPKQREAVELFFFEGLSQSEIGRRLGVSQQVVQKRLYGVRRGGIIVGGALARLREALAPQGHVE
jgi:DNA-directed RNA polymerase specialized sigma24 family protein